VHDEKKGSASAGIKVNILEEMCPQAEKFSPKTTVQSTVQKSCFSPGLWIDGPIGGEGTKERQTLKISDSDGGAVNNALRAEDGRRFCRAVGGGPPAELAPPED